MTNHETDELAVARATNQRLNARAQRLESELAAYRRAIAQWEINKRGTYIPHASLRAIGLASGKDILGSVRHLKHFERVEQAEAAIERVRRLHDALDAETDLTSPDHEITRGAAAKKIAAALDGWSPPAAVSVPPPAPRADDQAALRDRIRRAVCEAEGFGWDTDMLEPDEYGDVADAVLAVLPEPADQAAALNRAADAVFALDYDVMVGEEGDENLGSMREAWDLGTIHAEKLLRRLADEAAVVPPPALTEEGRLRAQVEVLQQDAERDQGLAKVGARCMREGHQGLIEQGRLVLEGWRFALSTALGLGTGAPWEAIHERVKELTAAVSGPCVAGEQQNETPEAVRTVAYGDGKGRVFCAACPRPADPVPLTAEDVDHWELCPSCGRHVVDVARTAEPRP